MTLAETLIAVTTWNNQILNEFNDVNGNKSPKISIYANSRHTGILWHWALNTISSDVSRFHSAEHEARNFAIEVGSEIRRIWYEYQNMSNKEKSEYTTWTIADAIDTWSVASAIDDTFLTRVRQNEVELIQLEQPIDKDDYITPSILFIASVYANNNQQYLNNEANPFTDYTKSINREIDPKVTREISAKELVYYHLTLNILNGKIGELGLLVYKAQNAYSQHRPAIDNDANEFIWIAQNVAAQSVSNRQPRDIVRQYNPAAYMLGGTDPELLGLARIALAYADKNIAQKFEI